MCWCESIAYFIGLPDGWKAKLAASPEEGANAFSVLFFFGEIKSYDCKEAWETNHLQKCFLEAELFLCMEEMRFFCCQRTLIDRMIAEFMNAAATFTNLTAMVRKTLTNCVCV